MNQIAPDTEIGDFTIEAVAGEGGMGTVYRAVQRSLDRTVALKLIRPELATQPEFRDRFLREAKLASSIDHPNVVAVHDVGEIDGQLFLAMQWVEGETLQQVINSHGAMAPARARRVTGQIASALQAVHDAGLVHRDVKPANIMLRRVGDTDHAYLTDFGIARQEDVDGLTRTGQYVGTPGFTSPEQIRGLQPKASSDLFSLGCVAFELLTGRRPFVGENAQAVQWASASDPRPLASQVNPDLDTRYDEIFVRALAIEPNERFASADEFATNLESAAARNPLTPPTDISATDPGSHPRTQIDPAAGGAAGAAAAGGAAGGAATMLSPAASGGSQTQSVKPRRGNPTALIALAVVALLGIAVGAMAIGGVFNDDSKAAAQAAAEARADQEAQENAEIERRLAREKRRRLAAERRAKEAKESQAQAAAAAPAETASSSSSSSDLWPMGQKAYTVFIFASKSRSAAEAQASKARSAGLSNVGVLKTTDFENLNPEPWWAVYIGNFATAEEAQAQRSEALSAGVPSDAYVKWGRRMR